MGPVEGRTSVRVGHEVRFCVAAIPGASAVTWGGAPAASRLLPRLDDPLTALALDALPRRRSRPSVPWTVFRVVLSRRAPSPKSPGSPGVAAGSGARALPAPPGGRRSEDRVATAPASPESRPLPVRAHPLEQAVLPHRPVDLGQPLGEFAADPVYEIGHPLLRGASGRSSLRLGGRRTDLDGLLDHSRGRPIRVDAEPFRSGTAGRSNGAHVLDERMSCGPDARKVSRRVR
jgi:hypothetical protein